MYKVSANGLTYPVQQINGQRISGPPLEWVGKEPPCDDHEVYITNLPRNLYEEKLLPLFSTCGIVHKMRLMMCFSGQNRGFVYVLFADQQGASNALQLFKRFYLQDRFIYAHPSLNKRMLLMGNVDPKIHDSDVEIFCKQATHCSQVIYGYKNPRKSKTLLIDYPTHYAAAMARRVFMSYLQNFGEKCFVRWYPAHY